MAIDAVYRTHFHNSVASRTVMVHCVISTNRGRSCSFPQRLSEPDPRSTDENVHMSAAPGNAITGFYGAQNLEYGMSLDIMGIVTEKCDFVGLE